MSLRVLTKGIVIRESPKGENDKVFTVYTEKFGKIKIVGKAIRKINSKLKSGLDFLALSEISFIEGKKQKILVESRIIKRFPGKKNGLSGIRAGHRLAGTIDKLLTGEEEDESIWKLAIQTLTVLSEEVIAGRQFLLYSHFFWKLIHFLGYCPDWENCLFCKKQILLAPAFLIPAKGKAFCFSCRGKKIALATEEIITVSKEALELLIALPKSEWRQLKKKPISQKVKNELKQILEMFVLAVFSQ